ncbi:hypothetical protein ACLOJK_033372 [Asimina triloba]
MKSGGIVFPHVTKAVRVSGTIISRLSSLSFMVVQRQTAASICSNPLSTGQQVFTTGSPSPVWISPPRTSTHNPSFRWSTEHDGGGRVMEGIPKEEGVWLGGFSFATGGGLINGGGGCLRKNGGFV